MDRGAITESSVFFTPADGALWDEAHANRSGFVEAFVASLYVARGYHVLRDFCTTSRDVKPVGGLKWHSTQLLHDVVGETVSDFLCTDLAARNPLGYGEPDLFVFREEHPNDPKIHFPDDHPWFFVEVKGPGDKVREGQTVFWGELEDAFGHDLVRLVRVAQLGTVVE
jgi:hypothetical protein